MESNVENAKIWNFENEKQNQKEKKRGKAKKGDDLLKELKSENEASLSEVGK